MQIDDNEIGVFLGMALLVITAAIAIIYGLAHILS